MAKTADLNALKTRMERLRRDSVELVGEANRIVVEGVAQFAESELNALNDYYRSAVASLKKARQADQNIRDIAGEQLDLLQESALQVIGHAREAVGILAQTRARLGELISRSAGEGEEAARKLEGGIKTQLEQAREAVGAVRRAVEQPAVQAARKAQKIAEQTAEKAAATAAGVIDAARQAAKGAAPAKKGAPAKSRSGTKSSGPGKPAARRLGSVLDLQPIAVTLRHVPPMHPSPDSRASRATSRAKKQRGGSGG